MGLIIERMPKDQMEKALVLLQEVFTDEQNIPVELLDIKKELKPIWWYAVLDSEIVGIVACWTEKDEWHLGRFAVSSRLRGYGIGKKLIKFALSEMFQLGAAKIYSEARDVSVDILTKLGGKVIGNPINFYGEPVTAMVLEMQDFLSSVGANEID